MFHSADLPERIPIFPLPGALLLPRGQLPLNIFEPRYLAMLEDTLKTDHRLIGMVQPINDDDGRLHKIGCAGRVIAFSETDDGRYMITLGGISRFRLGAAAVGFKPYLSADIDWSSFGADLGKGTPDPAFQRDVFLDLLAKYFTAAELNTDWEALKKADEALLINSLSMLCPFNVEDKQALLEAPSLSDRRETLVTLMEFALASGGSDGQLQ